MSVDKTLQNINFESPLCKEQYFLNRGFMLHEVCLIASIQENNYPFTFPCNMTIMTCVESFFPSCEYRRHQCFIATVRKQMPTSQGFFTFLSTAHNNQLICLL